MESINTCNFSGNIATDPELRATKTGFSILNFRLAVTNSKKVGDEWQEVPMFLDCKMFGNRADAVARYLTKGAFAVVSGSLWLNEWEKDGETRKSYEIHVDRLVMRDTRKTMEAGGVTFYEEEVPF